MADEDKDAEQTDDQKTMSQFEKLQESGIYDDDFVEEPEGGQDEENTAEPQEQGEAGQPETETEGEPDGEPDSETEPGEPEPSAEQGGEGEDEPEGDGASDSDDRQGEHGSDRPGIGSVERLVREASSKQNWKQKTEAQVKRIWQAELKNEGVRDEIDGSPAVRKALLKSVDAQARQNVLEERTAFETRERIKFTNAERMTQQFGTKWLSTWKSDEFREFMEQQPPYVQEAIIANGKTLEDFESVKDVFQRFYGYSKGEKAKPTADKGRTQGKPKPTRKPRSVPGPKPKPSEGRGRGQVPGEDATAEEHYDYLREQGVDYSDEDESEGRSWF